MGKLVFDNVGAPMLRVQARRRIAMVGSLLSHKKPVG